MDALLWELLDEGSPDDKVEVLIKMSEFDQLPHNKIKVIAQIGNIVSCSLRRGDVVSIRSHDAVVSMKAQRLFYLDPHVNDQHNISYSREKNAEQISNAKNNLTGKGVVVGIADWGLDFTHPNFLNPDGTTRFKYIWNQDAEYDGVNQYSMGQVHSSDDINNALNSGQPFQVLNYHPGKTDIYSNGMHGTHVLDIAAGNGSVGPKGAAPGSDLIGVHLASDKKGDIVSLGTSITVFNALHFLDNAAAEQPLVVNMSVGSHGDAHAGLSLIEQAIDYIVTSKPNRAIVQSCGNYYTSRVHAEGNLSKTGTATLEWLISKEDTTPNEIEIWYESVDDVEISLKTPDGVNLFYRKTEGRFAIKDESGNEIGKYYHRKNEPNTKLSQVLIILFENAEHGKWIVLLKGKKIIDGRFQAWIERDFGKPSNQSRFSINDSKSTTTTGSICNGFYSISVGAVNETGNKNNIAFFSSAGPTWDGRQKPDLTAPGIGILAAKSSSPFQSHSTGELTHKSGTSMAAPFVAGAVALMYEAANNPLAIQDVINRLKNSCIIPLTIDKNERKRYGNGILSIKNLLSNYINAVVNNDLKKKNFLQMEDSESMESLLDTARDQFPQLKNINLSKYFESLPKLDLVNESISKNDMLFRRQYGHCEPVWYGVVEFIYNNEVWVFTKEGRKKILVTPQSSWELKKLSSEKIKQKSSQFYNYKYAEQNHDYYTEDDKSSKTGDKNYTIQELIDYVPVSETSIVINKLEFEAVANFSNWKKPGVDHNTQNGNLQNNKDGKSPKNRKASEIIHLVLHETSSGIEGEATAKGFALPYTSHMAVLRNATVLQFNDLIQYESQVPGLNKTSIGIEFVNRGWLSSPKNKYLKLDKDNDKGKPVLNSSGKKQYLNCPPRGTVNNNGDYICDSRHELYSNDHEAIPASSKALADDQKTKFPEGNDFLYCFWGIGFNIYRIPPDLNQLEKEVELVKWLTMDLPFTINKLRIREGLVQEPYLQKLGDWLSVDLTSEIGSALDDIFIIQNKWLQVVSYNDVSRVWKFKDSDIPVDSKKDLKIFFVFTTGYGFLEGRYLDGRSGIISHNACNDDHDDGSFQALYTWLRLEKQLDSTKSYQLAKSLMKNNHFVVSLKADPDNKKIILLKVDDLSLELISTQEEFENKDYSEDSTDPFDSLISPIITVNKTPSLGTTIYANIKHGGERSDQQPQTAIFIQDSVSEFLSTIDIVLYLYGHNNNSIKTYLESDTDGNHNTIREKINSSKKRIIFVAPTLGFNQSEAGLLSSDSVFFDNYIEEIVYILNLYYFNDEITNIDNIIIAAHSAGGYAMLDILGLTASKYVQKINECWGFDSLYKLYNSTGKYSWEDWLKANSTKCYYAYSLSTISNAHDLEKKNKEHNFKSNNKISVGHSSIPAKYIQERIDNCAFLQAR